MKIILITAGTLIAGIIAGMGMGGGTLLIPLLVYAGGLSQENAQGMNLLVFLPAAMVSVIIHAKAGRINLKNLLPIIISGAVAAVAGGLMAHIIHGNLLRKMYGGLLIVLALFQAYNAYNKKSG